MPINLILALVRTAITFTTFSTFSTFFVQQYKRRLLKYENKKNKSKNYYQNNK